MQNSFWWPAMSKEVTEYVKSCQVCAHSKIPKDLPSGLHFVHNWPVVQDLPFSTHGRAPYNYGDSSSFTMSSDSCGLFFCTADLLNTQLLMYCFTWFTMRNGIIFLSMIFSKITLSLAYLWVQSCTYHRNNLSFGDSILMTFWCLTAMALIFLLYHIIYCDVFLFAAFLIFSSLSLSFILLLFFSLSSVILKST